MKCEINNDQACFSVGDKSISYNMFNIVRDSEMIDDQLERHIDALSSKTLLRCLVGNRVGGLLNTFGKPRPFVGETQAFEYVDSIVSGGDKSILWAIECKAVVSLYERAFDGKIFEPLLTQESIEEYHLAFRQALSKFDKGNKIYQSMAWLAECREKHDYVETANILWSELFDCTVRTRIADLLELDLCDVSTRHIVLLLSSVLGEEAFWELKWVPEKYDETDHQLRCAL